MIKILIGVLIVFVLLVTVVLTKALLIKPTEAKTVIIEAQKNERASEYGEKLSRLIQKETVSSRTDPDRTKFLEFHTILEEMFPKLHATCEKHVFNGSLLFKWTGKSSKKPILLMSHQDVVEANGEWKYPPFSGHIDENGNVWGRGTVDTKGSVFCIMTAVEELIAEGFVPEVDVYIASSCTEEWNGEGAPLTAEYLKNQGIELELVLDEGGMIVDNPIAGVKGTYGMVGVVEKGCGDVKFIAHGKGGHASAPGKNTPLVRLAQFMTRVEKKSPFRNQFSPTMKEMFRRMTPNMDFGMKVIFANMWLFSPLLKKVLPLVSSAAGAMLHTTIAFTTAKGADGLNVLPQEAYVTGNMRFSHHQPNEESLQLITKLAAKYNLETEVIHQDRPCPIVDYKSNAFQLIEEAAKEVYPGVGISPYVMTGATDAKYYSEVSKNCIRFAPLYINNQQYKSVHGLDENINQGMLPYGVDFYKFVIKKSHS